MMTPLFLIMASAAGTDSPARPCLPIASDHLSPTQSAVDDHKALRKALGEPMPQTPTMVMMYGRGGHLETTEYSIVLARGSDDVWRGTAVGRSQIWVKDAPYSPLKRIEWVLDKAKARQLEDALAHRCPFDRSAKKVDLSTPPPRGLIARRIDVVLPGRKTVTYYAEDGDGVIASIIPPPE